MRRAGTLEHFQRRVAAEDDLDLLVVGEINPDLIISDEDPRPVFGDTEKLIERASLEIGSSSAICACGCAQLGLRTALVGVVGDDRFGRDMLEQLSARGVDVSCCVVDSSGATGLTIVFRRDGDRAMLTYPGVMRDLRVEHVPKRLLSRARHLHVGGYFLLEAARSELPSLFQYARRSGLTTSVDCNWDPADEWGPDLIALLDVSDVFFCNAAEALRITRLHDATAAARELARHARVAVIKAGQGGAIAVADGDQIEVGAPHLEPVDTIGAGDNFDAGFLSRWVNNDALSDCLRHAVACGSFSTAGVGGTSIQATAQEAAGLAEELRSIA